MEMFMCLFMLDYDVEVKGMRGVSLVFLLINNRVVASYGYCKRALSSISVWFYEAAESSSQVPMRTWVTSSRYLGGQNRYKSFISDVLL
jgi:hypothetical protein